MRLLLLSNWILARGSSSNRTKYYVKMLSKSECQDVKRVWRTSLIKNFSLFLERFQNFYCRMHQMFARKKSRGIEFSEILLQNKEFARKPGRCTSQKNPLCTTHSRFQERNTLEKDVQYVLFVGCFQSNLLAYNKNTSCVYVQKLELSMFSLQFFIALSSPLDMLLLKTL